MRECQKGGSGRLFFRPTLRLISPASHRSPDELVPLDEIGEYVLVEFRGRELPTGSEPSATPRSPDGQRGDRQHRDRTQALRHRSLEARDRTLSPTRASGVRGARKASMSRARRNDRAAPRRAHLLSISQPLVQRVWALRAPRPVSLRLRQRGPTRDRPACAARCTTAPRWPSQRTAATG